MGSPRLPVEPTAARRRQPVPSLPVSLEVATPFSPRDIVFRSWSGRLFILATGLKVLVAIWRRLGAVPTLVQGISSAATVALIISVAYLVWGLFVRVRRQLLWRVRRKLILSYIFIGVVPALLIVGFGLIGAGALSMNIGAYLFKDGYDDVVRNSGIIAEAAVGDIARAPGNARDALDRLYANSSGLNYPGLSLLYLPASGDAPRVARAGRWEHTAPPAALPQWVSTNPKGFTGTISVPLPESPGKHELIIRSVRPGRTGFVIVDVPIDAEMISRLHDATGVKAGTVTVETKSPGTSDRSQAEAARLDQDSLSLFGRSVAFFDSTDWSTGEVRRATVGMTYRLGELYQRMARAQEAQIGSIPVSDAILLLLAIVAGLFLVIQIVALIMGMALARSITSSIHELFMGTERVQQGDFTHRISIETKDQLGELADSFNQMTGSIENLLQTAAEKKRLEEELRIARQIQMSLLPRGPLDVPGLGVTALCVPAREVGGDYYDLFPLPGDRLGVMIADVAGKGTSAALYMAELKGIVLSLSQIYPSPRQLLIEVNRIISANLDSRSFITMTYAVIDLAAATMTYARAGHTPLLYMPGPASPTKGAQILTPSGMVLGLRIDGAEEKFSELLEEERVCLYQGDIIVLYTDGITEAMNADSDLFGDNRLSNIVEEHGHLESGELRERILREIEAFVGGADQHDDMTMILMKVQTAAAAARVAV
jgi:sigma-B regulation protein RsbU (phosphoserine phosphatase)